MCVCVYHMCVRTVCTRYECRTNSGNAYDRSHVTYPYSFWRKTFYALNCQSVADSRCWWFICTRIDFIWSDILVENFSRYLNLLRTSHIWKLAIETISPSDYNNEYPHTAHIHTLCALKSFVKICSILERMISIWHTRSLDRSSLLRGYV